MWTPKRILLLVVGIVLFVSGYLIYGRFLGGIDGLPPLPEEYGPRDSEVDPGPPPVRRSALADRLRQAFGEACDELDLPIKLELQSKRMVLAARGFKLLKSVADNGEEDDGGKECRCLRLDQVSLALFSEARNDGREVEINTIQAAVAYLTFDRPISTPHEAGSRKIVAGELRRDIRIINNRRTASRDDDLVLFIPSGPLHYDEARRRVWTDDIIRLLDYQSKPKPIQIDGTGMEMELLTEPPAKPGAPAPRKARSDSVTGVKKIILQSGVTMHLYAAGQFLGGPGKESSQAKPASQPAEPSEKAHVSIFCPGRFQYEFNKDGDLATFDVPAPGANKPGAAGNVGTKDVKVIRHQEKLGLMDQLFCQHLVLKLHRKEIAESGREAGATDRGLDIESAHATGEIVTLISDAEKLDAHGNDFTFDAVTTTTLLKGTPEMWARQNGSEIHARELQLQEQKVQGPGKTVKTYQKATALGPGRIAMTEAASPGTAVKAESKKIYASWDKTLVSSKEGPYDLLTLTGSARFFDEEHDQALQADTLKVWMKAPPKEAERGPNTTPSPNRRPEPHQVEALGNVRSQSRELHIEQSQRLQVWFEDVPEPALPAPVASQPGDNQPKDSQPQDWKVGAPPIPAPPPDVQSQAGNPKTPTTNKPEEPPRPIHLQANIVQAWVQRSGPKSTLQRLWTEGRVHVQQAPAKPDEKGVDIRGETLEMKYHPEGNELIVRGSDDPVGEDIARLEMDKMNILGREVVIDQAANKASVAGAGAMTMVSDKDFQGNKLAKPVPLTIYWTKSMLFLGKTAEFYGGIQAEQENGRMQCDWLQVSFDKPIVLKEGMKNDQSPRVQTLICNRNVRVEDSKYEGKKLIGYQLITTPEQLVLTSNDEDDRKPNQPSEGNDLHVTGPGTVRIYQMSADPVATPGARKPATSKVPEPAGKSPEAEMKLTYVEFKGQMVAHSKQNKATFYDGVSVYVLPTENPRQEIDLDLVDQRNLPPGAMLLTCGQLTVNTIDSAPAASSKKYQHLEAKRRVNVVAREFFARSDSLIFNEQEDMIILTGADGVPAKLFRRKPNGAWDDGLSSKKIFYKRSTGDARLEGADSLFSGPRP